MTDPLESLSTVLEALDEARMKYRNANPPVSIDRCIAAAAKFDAACHDHLRPLLDEVKQLRAVKEHAESVLAEIQHRYQADDAESDKVSVNCRLNVFCYDIIVSEICSAPRKMYVGYLNDEDWPGHIVTATVTLPLRIADGDAIDFPAYLDWIQTSAGYERNGYATELVAAIEKDLGEIVADGGTDVGELFCASLGKRWTKG